MIFVELYICDASCVCTISVVKNAFRNILKLKENKQHLDSLGMAPLFQIYGQRYRISTSFVFAAVNEV